MIKNWAATPTTTSLGRVNTTLKSSSFRVRPMPNITTISRLFTLTSLVTKFQSLPTHKNEAGTKKASTATATTMNAMYLPTNLLTFFNVSMILLLLSESAFRTFLQAYSSTAPVFALLTSRA